MARPSFLPNWLMNDRTAEMAERVAGRSRMAVWQRVSEKLNSLGTTECRGYIRARAIPVIQEETDRLIEQEGRQIARHRERIVEWATDSLIRMVVSQVQQRRLEQRRRVA